MAAGPRHGARENGVGVKPDLEVVQVRDDQSFKVWSHGYPFRTVRWHFHPEYELHLITATEGNRYVGDHIGAFCTGDLVLVGPNLPHNWITDLPAGETVAERCLILQFTESFIGNCITVFPELRFLRPMLDASHRGLLFRPAVTDQVGPMLRELLDATDGRRIALFIAIMDRLGHARAPTTLASVGFRPDAPAYLSGTMNLVLQHIGQNFTHALCETDMARLGRQSISTFSRSFRRHTGMTFVHYVNALRIELACQHLVQTELAITEICFEVGFGNVSNFNRQFLALKGMPPTRFRSLQRAGRQAVAA